MDFHPDPSSAAFAEDVIEFFAEHLTAEIIERVHASGTVHDWGLHRALAARRWLGASWPAELGGQGHPPHESATLTAEMARLGVPADGWGTTELVARTLAIVGTAAQQAAIIPRVLAGEILICLGYSEPDSGSDVAAAKTRAVADADGWVINGQKMFTTLAHESAFVFLLARTNLDAPKHRGLTMFLVPMDAAGVEVRAIHTLGGERTNVTFYTDVRVPDSARVGDVDGGWEVMKVALAFERQPTAHDEAVRLLGRVEDWARATVEGGRPLLEDRSVRQRLARVAVDNMVGGLLKERMRWEVAQGRLPVVEGSMAKLWASEAFQRAASNLIDLLGPAGVLGHDAADAPAEGWIEQAWRHAAVTTIQAGVSEIQRSIIAERGLGLPRARPPAD